MLKLLILVFAGVLIPCECVTNSSRSDLLERWNRGIMSFSVKGLPDLISNSKDGIVVWSPAVPIYFLTQMAPKCKNKSQTCKELFRFINLKSKDEILRLMQMFNKIISRLPNDFDLKYTVYVIASNQYKFTNGFKQNMMIPTNKTKAVNVDFSKPEKARRIINNMVANATDNKVLNCIESSNVINKKQQIITVSGVYLNTCMEKSNYNNISMCKYYSQSNSTSTVPFMCMSGTYNYTESDELNAKVLKIPLKVGGFSANVFLPNEKNGLMDLVEKLKNVEDVEKAFNSLKPARIHMCLPLFDNIRKVVDFRNILIKEANVDTIFDRRKAQFKGLIENDKAVSLTMTNQKIILECNRTPDCGKSEESSDYSDCSEDLEEYEFVADHPIVIYYMFAGIPVVCSIGKPLMFS